MVLSKAEKERVIALIQEVKPLPLKYRDGKEHFEQLNTMLGANGIDWTYHFFFLSPEDYSPFFQAVRDRNWTWKSQLMQQLETPHA